MDDKKLSTKVLETASAEEREKREPINWGGSHVERARTMARYLAELADELEKGCHSEQRERDVKVEIDGAYDAFNELDKANKEERDALMCDALLASCQSCGEVARAADPSGRTPKAYENYAAMVIRGHLGFAPENADAVRDNQGLIIQLIRAYAENRGGSGQKADVSVARATEELAAAMGWPATFEAIKRRIFRRNGRKKRASTQ